MPAMDFDMGDIAGGTNDGGEIHPLRPVKSTGAAAAEEANANGLPTPLALKNRRRKKKKGGMAPAAPALTVIRGFETPAASGGEESDASTSAFGSPRMTPSGIKGVPGAACSPRMNPFGSSSGISALKVQLDALSLDKDASKPGLTREMSNLSSNGYHSTPTMSSAASDSDKTDMETYEVALDDDFVSSSATADRSKTPGTATPHAAVEGGLHTNSILRKMTAADFDPLRCLGKGAFGTVHLVKQRATGRLYAQKQFRKASLTVHKRLVEQTRTERTILESVNRHPFVVKLFYAFQDHEKLYLILEYAQGGELFTHLAMERMFSEEVAAFYMAEIVLALEHLHTTVRVVYRDLKPENCLLDAEGHLLLTDFGLSKVALDDDARCNSVLGTIEYMAPEVIEGRSYGMVVDYWSLGAIGFDLLTGNPPFGGANYTKIQQNILKQKLQLPYFLGPDSKDLLTRLLRKEPNKRLGYNMPKDLKLIKSHRFFRRIDWKMLERRELEPPIKPLITDPELAENFSKEFTDLPLSPVVERSSMSFASRDCQDASAFASAARDGHEGSLVDNTKGAQGQNIPEATANRDVEMISATAGPEGQLLDMSNPFGGFSFVASQSLLEDEDFML